MTTLISGSMSNILIDSRDNNLERENAKLVKELDRVNSEHQTTMHKQANASELLIKEYKQQNMLLQNSMECSRPKVKTEKVFKDEENKTKLNSLRTISNTTNEEESLVESPGASSSPGLGKRKRGKRGRGGKNSKKSYNFSPVLGDSQNIRRNDNHLDLRDKISNKRCISTSQDETENCDPSLVLSSMPSSHEDSIGSSSSYLGEPQRKKLARSERATNRKGGVQKQSKKEVSFEESDESVLCQERSVRRSLRGRTSTKTKMLPPSNSKVENSFLSPLVEREGTITVTTTTTLSPQKSRASFITPYNKRKKLFNNTPANEVN